MKFPQRTSGLSAFQNNPQQQGNQQQSTDQNTSTNIGTAQATSVQVDLSIAVAGGDNSINAGSTSTSSSTIVGLLHQNSMNSRQQSSIVSAGSPYGAASAVQIVLPGSSTTTVLQPHPSPSPFQSPTPLSSNNPTRNPVNLQEFCEFTRDHVSSASGNFERNESERDSFLSRNIAGNDI